MTPHVIHPLYIPQRGPLIHPAVRFLSFVGMKSAFAQIQRVTQTTDVSIVFCWNEAGAFHLLPGKTLLQILKCQPRCLIQTFSMINDDVMIYKRT